MKRFVADGVHQTSVADIVADVGVTERTFYRHFPTKHAVIFADYDIGFEWFARALARRPHGEPITASVRKAVDAFPFDFRMVREAATIRSRDLDQDIITNHIRRMRDQVADEIGRFIHERSKPTADGAMIADIAAHTLATAVFTALEAWMSLGGEDIDELSRLTDIALSALEDGLTVRCGTPGWTDTSKSAIRRGLNVGCPASWVITARRCAGITRRGQNRRTRRRQRQSVGLQSGGQRARRGVVDALTRTVAVATRDPNELVLMSADSGNITARVPLPGTVRHLQLAAPGGPVLVPVETANALVRVELPQGHAAPPIATGIAPHDAAQAVNGSVFVANEHGGTVAVLRGDETVKIFDGLVQPAGTAAAGNTVGVLDVRKNDLTVYDRPTRGARVHAGWRGPHPFGRRPARATDRDRYHAETPVRVFTVLPAPREVSRVAQRGGPYGIAYDAARDRLWVASSGTNELVGYDMSEPTPVVLQRFTTVQNPYTVGVDAKTGRLYVAGVSAGVVQVID